MTHNNGKLFDWKQGRLLTDSDACPFNRWDEFWPHHPFCIHPAGFRVFLSPETLQHQDEYFQDDPYAITENLDSSFHQTRIAGTLELIRGLSAAASRPLRILDVGCGRGNITRRIHAALPEAELTALDHSITAIESAASISPEIDYFVCDAFTPPFCPEYFDVIVLNNIWEHVTDPVTLSLSLGKVLNPGGHLIISTPSRYNFENLIRSLLGRPCSIAAHHVTEYSVGQLIEQLQCARFRVVSILCRDNSKESASTKWKLLRAILLPILRAYVQITHSHHCLADTTFIMASKGLLGSTNEPD